MNKEQRTSKWDWAGKREKKAFLALEDGTVFHGYSVGADADVLGEVVFNTGMTGYQEIITDPSYSGQIVTMTYTEIGNTGITQEDVESRQIFANGLIVHEMNEPRNWRSTQSLRNYLISQGVPALAGIETRALTIKLRNSGTLKGMICANGDMNEGDAVAKAREWCGLDNQDYAARVTCGTGFDWDRGDVISASWGIAESLPKTDMKIVAFDFGIKWNILRRLREQGMDVHVVPAHASAAEILAMKPDGVFLSNGPADPAGIKYAIATIADLIGKVPMMGICLGHQLLGLAMGGRTHRLKFGHHGCNQPVMDLSTRRVEITSQNHNFTVDPDSLGYDKIEVTHVNLNDQTVEGIRLRKEPVFSIQYHPEAAPGPHDAAYLFKRFRQLILES